MIIDWADFRKTAIALSEDGYIPVFGEFNDQLAEVVVECIWKAKKSGQKKVTLLIDSFGGRNVAFGAIKATMIESGLEFRGLVMGKAASNGFNLLQQCNHRVAIRDAYLMLHWGSQTLGNNELDAIMKGEKWPIEQLKDDCTRILEQISERTNVPLKKLRHYAHYERYFGPKHALSLNFIDEIVKDLPLQIKERLASEKSVGKK